MSGDYAGPSPEELGIKTNPEPSRQKEVPKLDATPADMANGGSQEAGAIRNFFTSVKGNLLRGRTSDALNTLHYVVSKMPRFRERIVDGDGNRYIFTGVNDISLSSPEDIQVFLQLSREGATTEAGDRSQGIFFTVGSNGEIFSTADETFPGVKDALRRGMRDFYFDND